MDLHAWTYAHGVTLDIIEPSKPAQNAHSESFNGKFRYECLTLHGLRQSCSCPCGPPGLEGGVQQPAFAQSLAT
jgi:hypothetical protein